MRRKFFTTIVCSAAIFNAHSQQTGQEIKFMCTATVSGQKIYKVLAMNYAASTVDGRKAEITENFIKWGSAERSFLNKDRMDIVRHELNRLAGTYSSYAEGVMYAGPPPTFYCEKAPAAKF